MKKNSMRVLKYLVIANIFILSVIAAWIFSIPGEEKVIKSLLTPYNIIRIFIVYTSVFLPLSAGSVFFVFNLTEERQFNPGTVNSFISSLNRIILPVFAVYSFLHLYMNPVLFEKKIWIENLSETADEYRNGIKANAGHDMEKAYVFSNLYLYIDPDNNEINEIHDDLYIKLLSKNGSIKKEEEEKTEFIPELLTGEKLIEISSDFLERYDYSSAIYYSEIAGKFKNSRKSSRDIVDKAAEVLKKYVETDPDKTILFNGKLQAEELLRNARYAESYYKTISLQKKFPADSELETHKAVLLEKLDSISFFYEDIEKYIFVPGKENITFRESTDNGNLIISCGKIVFADNDVYLFNINGFYTDSRRSWSAPFGKIMNSRINMNCIGRYEEKSFLPKFKNSREKITSVPLNYTGEDLINFSDGLNSVKRISIIDLFSRSELLVKGKFGETALIIEAAERTIRCINFLLILFISVYSGISFMKRGRGKHHAVLLLFPLVMSAAAAAEFILFNLNAGVFKNLLLGSGKVTAFILFPLFLIFEFGTALYLTVKRSAASAD